MSTAEDNRLTNSQCACMIADVRKGDRFLSNWEAGFIDSIDRQLQSGRSLSEKQQDILQRLWDTK